MNLYKNSVFVLIFFVLLCIVAAGSSVLHAQHQVNPDSLSGRLAVPDLHLQPQPATLMSDEQNMPFIALEQIEMMRPILYYSLDTLANKNIAYYGFDIYSEGFTELKPELVRPLQGQAAVDMYGLLAISVKAIQELRAQQQELLSKVGGYESRIVALNTEVEDLRSYLQKLHPYTNKTDQAYEKVVALEKKLAEIRAELDTLKP